MIEIPPAFSSYTSYSAKELLRHVDTLKAAIVELQKQVTTLDSKIASKCASCEIDPPATKKTKSVPTQTA